MPGPDNDVVIVFTHFLHHFFIGGVGLRQICDWCRLLWTYRESLDRGLLESRIRKMGLKGAKYPSANFNALFLPWHVSAHFAFERVTLRHLLDWALFLVNEGKSIDVDLFREAKTKYTYCYGKFADILTNLSIRYLKIPVTDVPVEIIEDAQEIDASLTDKVFESSATGLAIAVSRT